VPMEIFSAVEAWPWMGAIRTSTILYPLLNGTHILGVSLLIGAIAVVDLQVLRDGRPPAGSLALSVAKAGFAIAVGTGTVLFAVRATHYAQNSAMQIKAALLVLALINIVTFARLASKKQGTARALAATSLVLWTAVLFAGRWIGFT
jgi:hypothetical protein